MTTTMEENNKKNLKQPIKKMPVLTSTQHKHETGGTTTHVVWNSILAGSLAGITSTGLCYPFDVLRTKMQSAAMVDAAAASTRSTSAALLMTNPIHVLTHTLSHGGVRALYTGLSIPLAAQAVYKATVFAVNNASQQFLTEWNTRYQTTDLFGGQQQEPYRLTLMDKFWCGAMGGAVNAALFVTPVEYVRNQLIVQHTNLAAAAATTHGNKQQLVQGPMDVIATTIQEKGVLGLWRGTAITVARDSLGCGCFFVVFSYAQQKLAPNNNPSSFGIHTLVAGACAGLGFWVAALPLDGCKTLVQNGSTESARAFVKEALHKNGIVTTTQQLMSGWQVAFGRGAPSAAVTLGTYELCYRWLEQPPP